MPAQKLPADQIRSKKDKMIEEMKKLMIQFNRDTGATVTKVKLVSGFAPDNQVTTKDIMAIRLKVEV